MAYGVLRNDSECRGVCVLEQAYGRDVSQWTRQQLIEAAGVVTGLSAAEIGSLKLHDLESISAVGNNGLWSSTQVGLCSCTDF